MTHVMCTGCMYVLGDRIWRGTTAPIFNHHFAIAKSTDSPSSTGHKRGSLLSCVAPWPRSRKDSRRVSCLCTLVQLCGRLMSVLPSQASKMPVGMCLLRTKMTILRCVLSLHKP